MNNSQSTLSDGFSLKDASPAVLGGAEDIQWINDPHSELASVNAARSGCSCNCGGFHVVVEW